MKLRSFLLLFLAGLVVSCSSNRLFVPILSQKTPHITTLQRGSETLAVSVREKSAVAVRVPQHRGGSKLNVHVFYQNNSDQPIMIYPDSVEVVHRFGQHAVRYNLANISPQSLQLKSNTHPHFSSSFSSPSIYSDTLYQITYNPPPDVARRIKGMDRTQYDAFKSQINASVNDGFLSRVSLPAGFYVEGDVISKCGPTNTIWINVPVGDENHSFHFRRYSNQ